MMRLTILIDRYLPITGGAQQIVHQIARGLHERGHQVTVLTRRLDTALPRQEVCDGITIQRMGRPGLRWVSKATAVVGMLRYLRRHARQTDVLMGVPVSLVSDLLPTWLGAKLARKPYVVRATALNMFDDMLSWRSRGLLGKVFKLLTPPPLWRAALTRSSSVVAQSDAVAQRIRGYGLENVETCLAGVDTERFRPADESERMASREALGVPADHVVFIAVGRYVEAKNHITFLKAIKRLLDQRPQARVTAVVLGGTEPGQASTIASQLKQYTASAGLGEVVRFHENISNVEDFLRASDVFVFPSYFDEGVSNALMEAMVSGLALCSSDIPQTRAVVPGELGGYFAPKDDAALAAMLLDYVEAPGLCRARGAEVAAFARPVFSLDRVVETFERLLYAGMDTNGLAAGSRENDHA